MINRDDIEAGDKCYTRDGGCLVAREYNGVISIAESRLESWFPCGRYVKTSVGHPLDIIRIEKAPKPVVEEIYAMWLGNDVASAEIDSYRNIGGYDHAIKLTIINGKLEKSEQVK
jgi:hypothetical protein